MTGRFSRQTPRVQKARGHATRASCTTDTPSQRELGRRASASRDTRASTRRCAQCVARRWLARQPSGAHLKHPRVEQPFPRAESRWRCAGERFIAGQSKPVAGASRLAAGGAAFARLSRAAIGLRATGSVRRQHGRLVRSPDQAAVSTVTASPSSDEGRPRTPLQLRQRSLSFRQAPVTEPVCKFDLRHARSNLTRRANQAQSAIIAKIAKPAGQNPGGLFVS